MIKLRVCDLASEFGVTTDELMNLLRQMDVPVQSSLSVLTDGQVSRLRARWVNERSVPHTRPATVVTTRRRRKAADVAAAAEARLTADTQVDTPNAEAGRAVIELSTPPRAPDERAVEPPRQVVADRVSVIIEMLKNAGEKVFSNEPRVLACYWDRADTSSNETTSVELVLVLLREQGQPEPYSERVLADRLARSMSQLLPHDHQITIRRREELSLRRQAVVFSTGMPIMSNRGELGYLPRMDEYWDAKRTLEQYETCRAYLSALLAQLKIQGQSPDPSALGAAKYYLLATIAQMITIAGVIAKSKSVAHPIDPAPKILKALKDEWIPGRLVEFLLQLIVFRNALAHPGELVNLSELRLRLFRDALDEGKWRDLIPGPAFLEVAVVSLPKLDHFFELIKPHLEP